MLICDRIQEKKNTAALEKIVMPRMGPRVTLQGTCEWFIPPKFKGFRVPCSIAKWSLSRDPSVINMSLPTQK